MIAIGRKNYLFAGSDAGGRRAAAIYSLIESAKLNVTLLESCRDRVILIGRDADAVPTVSRRPTSAGDMHH